MEVIWLTITVLKLREELTLDDVATYPIFRVLDQEGSDILLLYSELFSMMSFESVVDEFLNSQRAATGKFPVPEEM